MKTPANAYLLEQQDMEDEQVGMEVDDAGDPTDILAEYDKQHLPLDADFFNSFEDDFDDTDIA